MLPDSDVLAGPEETARGEKEEKGREKKRSETKGNRISGSHEL